MLDVALTKTWRGALSGVIISLEPMAVTPSRLIEKRSDDRGNNKKNLDQPAPFKDRAAEYVILDLVDTLPTLGLGRSTVVSRFCTSQPTGQRYHRGQRGTLRTLRWAERPVAQSNLGKKEAVNRSLNQAPTNTHYQALIGQRFVCRLTGIQTTTSEAAIDLKRTIENPNTTLSWQHTEGHIHIHQIGFLPHQFVGEPPYALISIESERNPALRDRKGVEQVDSSAKHNDIKKENRLNSACGVPVARKARHATSSLSSVCLPVLSPLLPRPRRNQRRYLPTAAKRFGYKQEVQLRLASCEKPSRTRPSYVNQAFKLNCLPKF